MTRSLKEDRIVRRLESVGDPIDQAIAVGLLRNETIEGIVPIHDTVLVGNGVEITEARADGQSLEACAQRIMESPQRFPLVLSIVSSVARVLERVHHIRQADGRQARLIHGRLGLGNIGLNYSGDVWIGEFSGLEGPPTIDTAALLNLIRKLFGSEVSRYISLKSLLQCTFDSVAGLRVAVDEILGNFDVSAVMHERRLIGSEIKKSDESAASIPADTFIDLGSGQWDDPTQTGTVDPSEDRTQTLRYNVDDLLLSQPAGDADLTARIDYSLVSAANPPLVTDSAIEPVTELEILPLSDQVTATASPIVTMEMEPETVSRSAQSISSVNSHKEPPPRPPAKRPSSNSRNDKQHTMLGHYRVVAAIGKGGMGEIYLARSTKNERPVALKVLSATGRTDDEALAMLLDEAAIMARIRHPNVLRILDFGHADNKYYLASEYLEGRPLVRVMMKGYEAYDGLDYKTIAAIGAQAARGLYAAHTACNEQNKPLHIVHRDVSPQNIFCTYKGFAKVIDFGVARATDRFSFTQVGMVKGKAAYMSPEQTQGLAVDARSDVFSLGVCLWEMVAGKRLFKQPADYDTLLAVQSGPIGYPSQVRGHEDEAFDQIILGALQRDVSVRTQSAFDLARQLEAYAAKQGVKDLEQEVSRVMWLLFEEEARQERVLRKRLESQAWVANSEDEQTLRAVSGVSHKRLGHEITLVGEPDGLEGLANYGMREQTSDRILRQVREIGGDQRSDAEQYLQVVSSDQNVRSSPPPVSTDKVKPRVVKPLASTPRKSYKEILQEQEEARKTWIYMLVGIWVIALMVIFGVYLLS